MGEVAIGLLDNSVIDPLAKKIVPVVRFHTETWELDDQGQLFIIMKINDLYHTAFTWNPQPRRNVQEKLVFYKKLTTYHTWAYYGFFKPTIAEVLSQILPGDYDIVVAFETLLEDATIDCIVGPYHRATTYLYKLKEGFDIL